jgi:zinc ribbon protein
MANDPLPPIVCASCGRQNLPDSRFCSSCGTLTPRGASFGPVRARPRSLSAIAACGILTAAPSLYWDLPWAAATGPHDAYLTFTRIFGFLGFPLNILLLAASIGLFGPGKPWARRWMLWWSGLIIVYESVQLVVAVTWVAPRATEVDLGMTDLGDMTGVLGPDFVRMMIGFEFLVYWISMISLAAWAWWVLRRPSAQAFFEPQHVSTPPPVS